jgi:ABC-type multidrug transport system fused ATPase/permease subunit
VRGVLRYAGRYRLRYLGGYLCLATGTGLSLAIPWTIKRAIEALERDATTAPIAGFAALIVMLAVLNAMARLASRFTAIGAAQRVEFDLRNDLYASMQTFSPARIADRGALHHWFEALLHLVLAGRGDAGKGAAMKRVDGGDHFETAFVMAKLARELEEALIGFGPTVAEEDLSRSDQFHDRLSEAALRLVII